MFVFFPRLGMFSATISSLCVCVCVYSCFLSSLRLLNIDVILLDVISKIPKIFQFLKLLFHLASLDAFHHFWSCLLT